MPAKKTRQPADGVRYLLSADRKFRRLSLKKISERMKSARRRTRPRAVAKAAAASDRPMRATRNAAPSSAAPVAFVLVGIVSIAALIGALWRSPSPVDAQAAAAETENVPVLMADVASLPTVPTNPPDAPPVAKPTRAATAATASSASAAVTPKATSRPVERVVEPTEAVSAPAPPTGSVSADADVVEAAAPIDTVTLSGCLDYDGKSAWLTDTSGADAPRSRSWKSGFLKKRSPRIALVDGPGSVSAYDGRRVSVTGVLVDRQMRVNSMSPMAGDCE